MTDYLFTSERLGFRSWKNNDLEAFAAMNADAAVMEHFPSTLTTAETENFIVRLQAHHEKHGYCYFATEELQSGTFIGFIGIAYRDYDSPFTPSVDIGWRLNTAAWGKGYATEGAKRCLQYGFEVHQLQKIIATCTAKNHRSEKVMQKIGMTFEGAFDHSLLKDHPEYQRCLCYGITKAQWAVAD